MTRPSQKLSQKTPKNQGDNALAPAPAPAPSPAPAPAPPLANWAPVAAVAFAVIAALYLALYWAATWETTAAHTFHWNWLYLPDDLVMQWVGGDTARFGILDRAPVLGMATLIVFLAWLAGRPALALLRIDGGLTRLERAIFSIGLGLNGWSLYTLGIGLLGQLQRPFWFWAPAGLLLVTNVAIAVKRYRSPGQQFDEDTPESTATRWLWCGAPLAAIVLLGAMLPPWEFDVREYHLQVPREWFQQGRVSFMPHNAYGNMPLGAEMHALLAMSLWPGKLGWWWGALVGKTVIGSYAILTALALFALGRRFFNSVVGVVAALLYISTPWIGHVSMAGLIDGAVAFYFCLAAYAVAMAAKTKALGWPLAAGFLAGAAAACKYPALVMVVAPLGLAVAIWPKRNVAGRLKAATAFALAVAFACGPWFAKNYALTGNPTYPLAHGVFGGKSIERADDWKKAHATPRDNQGRSYTLAQFGEAIAQIGWRSDWINPAMAPLALAAIVAAGVAFWQTNGPWSREQVHLLWLFAGLFLCVFFTWWLFTHRIDRFWLPGLPFLALLAGIGAFCNSNVIFRVCAIGLIFLAVAGGTLTAASRALSDSRFLVALDDLRVDAPNLHDKSYNRTHPARRYLNEQTNVGRVLLVGDALPFDLEAPSLYATCFDACPFETLMKEKSRAERLAALKQHNITHVFVYWREIDRYRETYGFTDYVTRELVRDELAGQQRILRKIPLTVLGPEGEQPLPAESAELFEVVYDPPLR